MYLFIFLTLYMFRAHRADDEHDVLETGHFRPAHYTATDTEWQLPEVVFTQFVSPGDEHDVLETCRELKI